MSSTSVKLDFRKESDNSSGLQLAGLAASACARFVLDPERPNAIHAALSPKLYQGTFTEPDRFGLKVFRNGAGRDLAAPLAGCCSAPLAHCGLLVQVLL